MQSKPQSTAATKELRRRAEARLRQRRKQQKPKAADTGAEVDARRLPHELQVHQVELEMQNAALQEAQDRLEIQLEKYTDLYDFAPVGYLSLDEQGQILEVNLTGATLLGVERFRLIKRQFLSCVLPASRPVFLDFISKVFTAKGNQFCEVALFKENATYFWAGLHGTLAISLSGLERWYRVALSDITPIKQAKKMLQQNEALFSALVEQAPLGVYVVDGRLRLQQVNPKARRVFSKISPLAGRDLIEIMRILWPEKTADEIVARFRNTLKTGKPYYSPNFSERRRDLGVTEIYEWQTQRITLPGGQHGVVCFFNNITERKHTEAAERRIEVLAASNRKLEREILRRRAAEQSLRKSQRHLHQLLVQSRQMQIRLRSLSHQVLVGQEEERKRISRELHDVIAQTLTGIIVRLAILKGEALTDPKGLDRSIGHTQELVEHSVEIVHRFAQELRPPVLDDLGLVPALQAYLRVFKQQTGIYVSLSISRGVERVKGDKRTVLYRVAQEALTNVASHAHASRAEVRIQKQAGTICLVIRDDGQGFAVESELEANTHRRLGLLGMRERVEMVKGTFTIESSPGKGTIIHATVPWGKGGSRGGLTRSRNVNL